NIRSIAARSSGIVTDFTVRAGQAIQEGEILAIIEQPELKQEFLAAFSAYEFLLSHQAEKRSFLENQIAVLEKKLQKQQKRDWPEAATSVEQSLMELKNKLYNLDNDLADAERNLEKSRENYKWRSAVIAPFTGMVTEVKATNGQEVSPGFELFKAEPFNNQSRQDIKLDLYVSSGNAKKIRKGMEVFVALSTVKPEENGYVMGKVHYVSEYPVSEQSIAADISNEGLARNFASGSPPYKVTIKLLKDPANMSGFRWSSGRDPETTITAGILCKGKIVVEEQAPIVLVIPSLKKFLIGDYGS
ncbi:MAG: NHLP bacteriocin system secretion protein, partial [Chlorobiaceae bacterium]|nr:NHLP bacteriocin system secretion protein [Chlorobiaceae bacterium]